MSSIFGTAGKEKLPDNQSNRIEGPAVRICKVVDMWYMKSKPVVDKKTGETAMSKPKMMVLFEAQDEENFNAQLGKFKIPKFQTEDGEEREIKINGPVNVSSFTLGEWGIGHSSPHTTIQKWMGLADLLNIRDELDTAVTAAASKYEEINEDALRDFVSALKSVFVGKVAAFLFGTKESEKLQDNGDVKIYTNTIIPLFGSFARPAADAAELQEELDKNMSNYVEKVEKKSGKPSDNAPSGGISWT